MIRRFKALALKADHFRNGSFSTDLVGLGSRSISGSPQEADIEHYGYSPSRRVIVHSRTA
jgi:hypothetical protein